MAESKKKGFGFSGGTNYGVGKGAYYTQPNNMVEGNQIKQNSNTYLSGIEAASSNSLALLARDAMGKTLRQSTADSYMEWTMKWTMANQNTVLEMVSKSGSNSPQLADSAMWQLDKLNRAGEIAKNAQTPDQQRFALKEVAKYKRRITELSSSIDAEGEAIKLFRQDAQDKQLNVQGGLNLNSPKGLLYAKQMGITTGMNPGTMTWLVDEDGDWAVRHESAEGVPDDVRLKEPTITKAAIFFSEEPGIIPKSTEAILNIQKEQLSMIDKNGGIMPQYAQTLYRRLPNGDIEKVSVTNQKLAAVSMAPFLKAKALNYSSNYDTAEAYWDSLPAYIRDKVKVQMDKQKKKFPNLDYNFPGDDLQVGLQQVDSVITQLDLSSWSAIEQAMYMQAQEMLPKEKVIATKRVNTGSGGGSNDMGITEKTIEDLMATIKDEGDFTKTQSSSASTNEEGIGYERVGDFIYINSKDEEGPMRNKSFDLTTKRGMEDYLQDIAYAQGIILRNPKTTEERKDKTDFIVNMKKVVKRELKEREKIKAQEAANAEDSKEIGEDNFKAGIFSGPNKEFDLNNFEI